MKFINYKGSQNVCPFSRYGFQLSFDAKKLRGISKHLYNCTLLRFPGGMTSNQQACLVPSRTMQVKVRQAKSNNGGAHCIVQGNGYFFYFK